ncbi:MAG: YeeE/YedE thiosulfate transporter family protein [Planctomycetota bacterium]
MTHLLSKPRWSPYAVGAGIGVLSWVTFLVMGKQLGVSTTFVRVAGAVERAADPAHVEANAYLVKNLKGPGLIDWQFALVLALLVGGALSAGLSRSRRGPELPALWRARFGDGRLKRHGFAVLGGALVLFGARLAGGCTSGHGITGTMQFAVSSWVTLAAIFVGGIAAARAIYGGGNA